MRSWADLPLYMVPSALGLFALSAALDTEHFFKEEVGKSWVIAQFVPQGQHGL